MYVFFKYLVGIFHAKSVKKAYYGIVESIELVSIDLY